MFIVGAVPGLPKIPFYAKKTKIKRSRKHVSAAKKEGEAQRMQASQKDEDILPQPDPIILEVGYGLIPYVDETQGGDILSRIRDKASAK